MNQTISMVIANYNQSKYLEEAIDSIYRQNLIKEIIVVDDSSSDNSIDKLNRFKKIRILKNTFRMGISYSLNLGIEQVTSNYVMIQGADDISMPNRAEYQLEKLIKGKIGFLFSSNTIIDTIGNKNSLEIFNRKSGDLFYELFQNNNCICAPAVAFDKTNFNKYGKFNLNLQQLQDFFLWLKVTLNEDFLIDETEVVKYRLHNSNISQNNFIATQNRIKIETQLIYRFLFQELIKTNNVKSLKKLSFYKGHQNKLLIILDLYLSHNNMLVRNLGLTLLNEFLLTNRLNQEDLSKMGLTIFDIITLNSL